MPLFCSGELREREQQMGKNGNSTPTTTTATMDASEGAKTSVVASRASRDMSALMSSCPPIFLKFIDVNYRVKAEAKQGGNLKRIFCQGGPTESGPEGSTAAIQDRAILNGITGMACPGEILAVLGPSGSGKSTLLNTIAGRLHGRGLTGMILANGRRLSKSVLRRTGFVTQDDVLYPHLTVRETLVYCSLLRLPRSLTEEEKVAAADAVIAELGLGKCEHTVIGNSFIRGVSGGERKRVCIAHEMLLNPSLLVLDEPTSGLDSTAAHRLVTTLEAVASRGRTVVTSIHQPSSRVYQMFRSVLVLSEGRCLYYGKGSEAMGYFESIGFSPAFPMNPADFLLDLANGVCQTDGATCERERPNVKQSLISSYNTLLAPQIKAACTDMNTDHPSTDNNHDSPIERRKIRCTIDLSNWVNQFTVLMRRSLKERRHETFNALRVSQVLAAALLSGIMWWHSDFRNIQDRLGLLFFISIFWGVFPSFNAVFAFPQERAIFMKERASGMYNLSSYFMARIIGDMPMELILPTLFLTMSYWMSGLKPDGVSFVLTLLVLLGYVLVSQGLGLFLGALIMDAKQASTVVTVTMLAFVLTGGFYVHKVPSCLAWIKYISTTFYSYRLLIGIQYGDGNRISTMLGCRHDGAVDPSCKFVFEDVWGQVSPGLSLAVLLAMFFGYRLLAYLALMRIRT